MNKRYILSGTLLVALTASLIHASMAPEKGKFGEKNAEQPVTVEEEQIKIEQPVEIEWKKPEKKSGARPVLLRIKNDTSDDILVAIKGHTTRNDLVNALRISKGRAGFTFVGNISRKGPFIIARAKDLKAQKIKTELGKEQRYTVAFKLPKTAYIFPIGRLIVMGRGESAAGYGTFYNSIVIGEVEGGLNLRAKRNFPWTYPWEKAWVPLERKEIPFGTQGEPIITW